MEKDFHDAVVIFIDLLGTQDRTQFDGWYEVYSIFNRIMHEEIKLDKSHHNTIYKRVMQIFSDCAYLIYDYKDDVEENKKDKYKLMCTACYNTDKVFIEFLKNGFLARGAMTYGPIYYEQEKSLFFGPAMNIAYKLESECAKYPRMIIDPKYAENLYNHNERMYRNNGKILKQDTDDYYYLHYLNRFEIGYNELEGKCIKDEILTLCNKYLERTYEDEQKKLSIQSKYQWLKNYIQHSIPNTNASTSIDITNEEEMKKLAEQELKEIQSILKQNTSSNT